MSDQAHFETLGISPTTDGRIIRAAFLRLARIYHPDRFVGQPDDVRAEAEKRMKEATVAYEALREAKKTPEPPKTDYALSEEELRDRAARYRQTIEARHREEQRNRTKWDRWDELERKARERQAIEAEIAAQIKADVEGTHSAPPPPQPSGNGHNPPRREGLADRLDAARRGEHAPLVRRTEAADS